MGASLVASKAIASCQKGTLFGLVPSSSLPVAERPQESLVDNLWMSVCVELDRSCFEAPAGATYCTGITGVPSLFLAKSICSSLTKEGKAAGEMAGAMEA